MDKTTKITLGVIAGVVLVGGISAFALISTMKSRMNQPASAPKQTGPAQVASEPKNACVVVTAKEVSEVMGQKYTYQEKYIPGANKGKPGQGSYVRSSSCPYAASVLDRVNITIKSPGTDDDQQAAVEYLKEEYQRREKLNATLPGYKEVTGLGDDAYWDDTSATLYVLSGNYYYQFQMLTNDQKLPDAKKLAATADL